MCLRSFFALPAFFVLTFIFGQNARGESPLMAGFADQRGVLAGKIEAQIETGLANARRLMAEDPSRAEQGLKLKLDVLETAPAIDAELRNRLGQELRAAIRQARAKKVELDQRTAEAQENKAAAKERERLSSHLVNEQERIKQFVERLNSLLDESRFGVATEDVISEIQRQAGGSSIESAVAYGGRFKQAVHESEALWQRKSNGFVRTLAGAESSAVPFADETPIVYLDAERWADITGRREKYKSIDLHKAGSSEQQIHDALNKTTELDVVETPLKDVVQYLSDLHGIPIVLSLKKIAETGITADTPITKNLHGVTLRSALRLLLRDLELTYLVRDEVVEITTSEDAELHMINKVYPVADLVVPIRMPMNVMGLGGMNGINGSFGTGMPNSGANPGFNGPNMMPGMQPGGVNFF